MPAPFSETIPVPLASLIGRRSHFQAIRTCLADPDVRLVVLTGTGGVGKMRLATAVAIGYRMEGEPSAFPGGIAFVSLVGVDDPDLLLQTIASTLEIAVLSDVIPALSLALQDRRMLLVLDNFEQIIDAAPHVVTLLRALPQLSVLVTSRRVLRIAGEIDFPVPTLPVPDERHGQRMVDLADSPAVSLFLQRAGATGDGQPRFGDRDASALAAICRRLDGLPLAIELAAARTVILSPAQLLSRLNDRFGLLTRGGPDLPIRHQTLRATIGWSYDPSRSRSGSGCGACRSFRMGSASTRRCGSLAVRGFGKCSARRRMPRASSREPRRGGQSPGRSMCSTSWSATV